MNAESAYLFRHAILRDVAYSLWLPTDRAQLHEAAMEIIEHMPGADIGRLAAELAEHAHLAQQAPEIAHDVERIERLQRLELRFLRLALVESEKHYHADRMVDFCRRILALPVTPQTDIAHFEFKLANELQNKGKLAEASSYFEHALKLARQLNLHAVVANCMIGQSRSRVRAGQLADAERMFNETLAYATAQNLPAVMAQSMSSLGGIYEDTARMSLAEQMHKQASDIARQGNVEAMYLSVLGNLANHYRTTGRLELSISTLEVVLEGFCRLDSPRSQATALNNLGRTNILLHRLDQAQSAFERALAILQPMGETFSVAFALGNLAEVWIARGQLQQAQTALEGAISRCEETANLMFAAAFKAKLSDLQLMLGERDAAHETLEESRADFIHSGTAQYIPAYCDIVRLRVAADAATAPEELVARKTAKLHALAPQVSWLPVMRQILSGMKKAGSGALASMLELKTQIASGESLIAEIEAAIKENRPALVFHGYLPSELPKALREALLTHFAAAKPQAHAQLAKLHPELLAALKNPVG